MVNLAGLVSARLDDFPRTTEQLFYHMDPMGAEKVERVVSRLGILDEATDAFGVPNCIIGRNGLALVGDDLVDVWAMRWRGQSCEAIADYIWEARAGFQAE